MQTPDKKLQTEVGLIVSVLGFLSGAIAILDNILVGNSVLSSFSFSHYTDVYINLLSGLVFFLTIIWNKKWLRAIQVIFMFIVGISVVSTEGPYSFYGMFILISSVMLGSRYKIFSKGLTVLIAGFLVLLFAVVFYFTHQPEGTSLLRAVGHVAFVIASVGVLYFSFEDPIKRLLKEKTVLADKVRSLEPISILGKKISSIIHSLKNDVQAVNALSQMMQLDSSKVPTYSAKLKEKVQGMGAKINSILYLSSDSTAVREQIDLTKMVAGLYYMYLGENLYSKHIGTYINLKEMPQVYVWGDKTRLSLLLENVISNALEALTESTHNLKLISIYLTDNSLTIQNTGGIIKQCSGCEITSCSKLCPVFKGTGNTTKKNGSGFGIPTIFDVTNEFGWNLSILREEPNITKFTWTFNTQERD